MHFAFDRGTFLLEDPPPGADLSQIPGLVWDERVGLYRCLAYAAESVRSAVVRGEFGNPDFAAPTLERPAGWEPPALRPYQEAALASWEIAQRRGVVVLPTGSGKTKVAIAAMVATGRRSLCLVPTLALVDQWIAQLSAHYRGRIGRIGDGVCDVTPVTVATFEGAYRRMDVLGNSFELLVVDEAHHFGTGMRDEALEMCAATARLGLTATPPDPEGSRLRSLLGPVVHQMSIADLAGSYLADFQVFTLETELNAEERHEYDACMGVFRDFQSGFSRAYPGAQWKDLVRIGSALPDGRRALAGFRRARELVSYTAGKRDALRTLLHRHVAGSKTLVFTADNAAAYSIARDHLLMPITCDIGRAEREEALARFRSGEYRALVSARVLNEGVDVPDADVAVIVAGTHGGREHVQRIGRLLRPGPGKVATVYELVARRTMEVRQAERRREALVAGRASRH